MQGRKFEKNKYKKKKAQRQKKSVTQARRVLTTTNEIKTLRFVATDAGERESVCSTTTLSHLHWLKMRDVIG